MCLPGLHITLGVFHRLFTLFEDECHQLDLELAELTNPQAGDRPAYCSHSNTVREERKLLDAKALLEDEIKWLEQTTSYLTLNSTNPSSDPALLAVLKVLKTKKEKVNDIVCSYFQVYVLMIKKNLFTGKAIDISC